MKIKAIIVDDNIEQQEILNKKISSLCPNIELAGFASSVIEGVDLINTLKPQLVFLDVEMPPHTGFDLLNEFRPVSFDVIFVTAFTDFAYRAFKVAAVDYLHKPFSNEELILAVAKAEEKIRQNVPNNIHYLLSNIHSNTADKVKIGLPTLNGYRYVSLEEIIHVEASKEYSKVYFRDKNVEVVSKKIGDLEELLSEFNFYRVHHSHIVNLRHVKQYIRGEGGQACMIDGSVVSISKKNKEGFLQAMNSL